ncbi:hypothetical protein Tco_0241998 [Tanacetum coccineum]
MITTTNIIKDRSAFKTYAATNGYTGNLPLCKRCRLHHTGPCSVKCQSGATEAWWAHDPQVPQIKVSHPPRFYQDLKKFYWLTSRGVVLEVSRRVKGVISPLYNNPYLKDVQAFYAKELPISSPDPITPPAILTPSPVLPPSLLFDPRYFFVPEELLPPKKRICSSSSSPTTLSNLSQNQTRNLVSPSSSVYTPTAPQILEIGKSSIKMHLKHHEEQIEDILNYLDELSFHRIKKNGQRNRTNGNELKTELKRIRTQIIRLQKKQTAVRAKDKIACWLTRISDLEQIIEKIQARHQTNQEDL